jgi:hypothetical protein
LQGRHNLPGRGNGRLDLVAGVPVGNSNSNISMV